MKRILLFIFNIQHKAFQVAYLLLVVGLHMYIDTSHCLQTRLSNERNIPTIKCGKRTNTNIHPLCSFEFTYRKHWDILNEEDKKYTKNKEKKNILQMCSVQLLALSRKERRNYLSEKS